MAVGIVFGCISSGDPPGRPGRQLMTMARIAAVRAVAVLSGAVSAALVLMVSSAAAAGCLTGQQAQAFVSEPTPGLHM